MPTLTRPQMRAVMRLLLQDNDASGNYGLSDDELNNLIAESYYDYMAKIDRSVVPIYGLIIAANDHNGSEYAFSTGVMDPAPREWIRAERFDDVPGFDQAMERIEMPEMKRLISGDVPGISATQPPRYWAIEQESGLGPSWTIYIYPDIASRAISIDFFGTFNPYPLQDTQGSGPFKYRNQPKVTEPEAYWICRVAAYRACPLLNRSEEFRQDLARDIPDNIKAALGIMRQYSRPRVRGEEKD